MGNVNQAIKKTKNRIDEDETVESDSILLALNPLELNHVLGTIFAILDGPTLKSARSVSSLWREEATRQLLSRGYLRVPREFYSGTIRWDGEPPKFKLGQVHNLRVYDAWDIEIFKKMGVIQSSPSSSLDMENVSSSNIKTLEYNSWPNENLTSLLQDLPTLTQLTRKDGIGFDATFLKILVPGDQTRLVQSLLFTPELLPGDTEIFEKALCTAAAPAGCKNENFEKVMRLRQLTINLNYIISSPGRWPQVIKILSKLFELSQNSLEDLKLESPLGCFLKLCIPRLENVKILRLVLHLQTREGSVVVRPENFYSIFPPNFKLLEKLPKLRHVEMRVNWDRNVSLLWASAGSAPHVTSLVLDGSSSPTFVVREDFVSIFPNLKKLSCLHVQYFERLGKILWKFVGLKILELGLDTGFDTNRYPRLDALLTGFSPGVVERLRTSNFLEEDGEEKERIFNSRRASILDLKELQELRINFFNLRSYGPFSPFLLSPVTAQHAFSLMPRLQVTICVENFDCGNGQMSDATKLLRRSLDLVSKFPNVTLIP